MPAVMDMPHPADHRGVSRVLEHGHSQIDALFQYGPDGRIVDSVFVAKLDADAVRLSSRAVLDFFYRFPGPPGIDVALSPEPPADFGQSLEHLPVGLSEALRSRRARGSQMGHRRHVDPQAVASFQKKPVLLPRIMPFGKGTAYMGVAVDDHRSHPTRRLVRLRCGFPKNTISIDARQ